MKPTCLSVVPIAWCLSLVLCICCASRCAHAQDAATPAAPIATPPPAPASADILRKQAEDVKLKDPKASAALYAQLVASDATPADKADDLDNQADELLLDRDWKTAEQLARQAIDLHKQASDSSGEAKTTRIIAQSFCGQGKYQDAFELCENALVLDRKSHRFLEEASALRIQGIACLDLSRYSKAIGDFNQALAIYRTTGNRNAEAAALINIGNAYDGLSRYSKVIDYCNQALAIDRSVGNRNGEAHALNGIGIAYDELSQYSKSIDYCTQALTIDRSVGDRNGEANALTNIGNASLDLSQYSKAIDDFNQALPIYHSIGNRNAEANALMNVGNTYNFLSQYLKAVDCYHKALPIFRSVNDQNSEANTLMNLGVAYNGLSDYSMSIDDYHQALLIFRGVGDRNGEASALVNIGAADDGLSQYAKAIVIYTQALPIFQLDGRKESEASTFKALMQTCSNRKNTMRQPRLAIYYGKRFVNTVQSIRQSNASLDKSSRASYVDSKASGYRELADLLIRQGRLPEAQQVLRLLKDQEFYDFLHVQGESVDPIAPAETITLTPREKRWSDAYDSASAHLEELQGQYDALNRIAAPTPVNKAKMIALKSQVNAADASVQTLLAKTAKSFAEPVSQQDRLPDTAVAGDVAAALNPGEAALYTIVSPDRLDLILILPPKRGHATTPKVYASPIKQVDLYQQVYRFRTALTDTQVDPRPLASSLHDLVLKPVKRDLVAAHVKTILFSLDDALRYIPPAALYDDETKRYVVQDYTTALITLAGKPVTRQKTALAPEVIGAGVSQSPGSADPPLPGVRKELSGIVHQEGDAAGSGLYPGTRMLDNRFTRAAIESSLATHRYPMVHLASHFLLHDTDADSYLLLGDGTQLSVREIRQDPKRFADVDLLTLSACDTAMEVKSSTGREVEGLGALAQSLGAKAVLASLWPVSDTETPKLMIAFYAYHKAHPKVALPDALRQAQLSLLKGKGTSAFEAGGSARGTMMVGVINPKWRPFKASASAPDAHPYYWAPFVLLGDWK